MSQSGVETALRSGPSRILLVEDEPIIRFAIAETLRDLGVVIIEAATGDEAWDYLASGAEVDLVFTDHRVPGSLTGAQLAARIREHFPALNVIVTSAHFDGREWAEPVIRKPYNLFETATHLVDQARKQRKARQEGAGS